LIDAHSDFYDFFLLKLPFALKHTANRYDLKQKHFFRNIVGILTYAFIGTTVACFITGGMMLFYNNYIENFKLELADCLSFGAFISVRDGLCRCRFALVYPVAGLRDSSDRDGSSRDGSA
jgi:sodium/hydrogen exchanger-like protein 6/7